MGRGPGPWPGARGRGPGPDPGSRAQFFLSPRKLAAWKNAQVDTLVEPTRHREPLLNVQAAVISRRKRREKQREENIKKGKKLKKLKLLPIELEEGEVEDLD